MFRYNLDNSVELFISNCFQSLQSKQNTDLNLNSRRRMLTVSMALIHILINSPNRIKFPVPPFNSIFLCCSDPNACGLHDPDSSKLHGVFRCKIQVQKLLSWTLMRFIGVFCVRVIKKTYLGYLVGWDRFIWSTYNLSEKALGVFPTVRYGYCDAENLVRRKMERKFMKENCAMAERKPFDKSLV